MIITISANLTQEFIDTIAKSKGYEEVIHTMTDSGFIQSTNPQTKEDFICQVYKTMIENDATNIFLSNAKQLRAEQERLEEEAIRNTVQSAITSSIS